MGVPKSFYQALNAAGIPFFAKRTDSLPKDAQDIAAASTVPHTVVYRRSLPANGSTPPSGDPNVPDYSKPPELAGTEHWEWHKAHFPPELDPATTWVEVMNEVDKNRAEWLAACCYQIAQEALADGYKVLFFGWSAGEPEPDHWRGYNMVRLLRLLAEHPDRLGIALHEYSYVTDNIWRLDGWLVGRFRFLFSACDELGIARPKVAMTEWGWTYQENPAVNQAMADILSVAEVYAQYPQVLGAAVWALNEGWAGIAANYTSKLIAPLKAATLSTTFPDTAVPPPPDDETLGQFLWRVGMEQTTVSLNSDAALQSAMRADGYGVTGSEKWVTYKGQRFAVQPANRYDQNAPRVYVCPVPDWGATYFLAGPDAPGTSQPPLTNRPTMDTRITQAFGANPANYPEWGQAGHEGVDIAAPLGVPYFAARAGTVVWASNGRWSNPSLASAYGYNVVIDHGDCLTHYAHARAPLPVRVGQKVKAGEVIGYSGNTGASTGPHLHFAVLVKAATGRHPATKFGWFIDPTYVLRLPAPPTPPSAVVYNLLDYLVGDGRMYDVRHYTGATETFQCQTTDNRFYFVKNNQWERLTYEGGRDYDTSPGPAPAYAERPGAYRYYHQFDPGKTTAQWFLPQMRIGQQFAGTPHQVQFYYKDTGQPSAANSGTATNVVTLAAHYDLYTFWERPLADVIKLQTSHEAMFFARGYGLVGWEAAWGKSGYFQDVTGRPSLVREAIPAIPAQ